MLDVPVQLALFVARLLAAHRREIGTRRDTRALSTWRQAVFALAWFRDRPDVARLGKGFGISQATAYRYLDEAITVLAARAPVLRETLERAREEGLPYLILDGKVVAADRLKEKTISRKGKEIDRWYSGKAHGFGGGEFVFSHPIHRGERGVGDGAIAGAAAKIAGERLIDVLTRRSCAILIEREQAHHDARRAKAALRAVKIDHRLLDRVQLLALGEVLDGEKFCAVDLA